MTAKPDVDGALFDVAMQLLYVSFMDSDVGWEDYPEIGEHDWERVMQLAVAGAELFKPTPEKFKAAYELLSARADKDNA